MILCFKEHFTDTATSDESTLTAKIRQGPKSAWTSN